MENTGDITNWVVRGPLHFLLNNAGSKWRGVSFVLYHYLATFDRCAVYIRRLAVREVDDVTLRAKNGLER